MKKATREEFIELLDTFKEKIISKALNLITTLYLNFIKQPFLMSFMT